LVVAIWALWFCLRRRKRNRQNEAPSAHAEVISAPSPTHGYASEPKYSVVTSPHPSGTVGSPDLSSYSPGHSFTRPSPYTTPPPVQSNYSSYHPAHAPQPMQYYPPPDASRPEGRQSQSHEMPTIRSPEAANIVQPRPMRLDGSGD